MKLKNTMRTVRITAAAVLMACFCCAFAGCRAGSSVDTLLAVDDSYAGSRTMTCRFSLTGGGNGGAAIDSVIEKYCPPQMTFEKKDTEYVFTLSFSSRTDYEEKAAALLGVKPTVIFSQPDTIFTSGYCISEDFSSADLFGWLKDALAAENLQSAVSYNLQCGKTELSFAGRTQRTGDEIAVNRVSGCGVDKIRINTVRHGSSYDRTFTFQIPRKTTNALGDDIVSYMNARTAAEGQTEWKDFVNGREYIVTYKNISADRLLQYTDMLFNSRLYGAISYGADESNESPFILRSLFEETLDTSSYMGADGGSVPVEYTYSQQGDTVLTEGSVYRGGKWRETGTADENGYTVKNESAALHVRIPDAVTYPVAGTDITVSCEGNGNFERTVAFHFAQNNAAGARYAQERLQSRGSQAAVAQIMEDNGIRCEVTAKGSAEEISEQMTMLFGKGNAMAYQSEGEGIDVHNATKMEDSIRMAGLYADGNENSPVTYIVRTNGKEQINDLRYEDESRSAKVNLNRSDDGAVRFRLNSADTVVTYNGYTPRVLGIAVYFFFALCVIAAVIFIIVLIKRHGKPAILKGRTKPTAPAREDSQESTEDILSKI